MNECLNKIHHNILIFFFFLLLFWQVFAARLNLVFFLVLVLNYEAKLARIFGIVL